MPRLDGDRPPAHLARTSEGAPWLPVAGASGCRIRTRDGREFVDWLSGIGVANVGHGDEEVRRAVAGQLGRHLHVMVYGEYEQAPQTALADELCGLLPDCLDTVYFTSSGAEAVEGAIKLVRKATGRSRIVAFEGAYHGDTTGALALSGAASHRDPFGPLLPDVVHAPYPAGDGFLPALELVDASVAAVVVEPIQAEAGVRIPPPGFLPALAERCREAGALLVADEVQVGLGRSGHWLASGEWGVVPDVLLLAKALGGGLPLGAFVARRELMDVLARDPELGHLTTFGGHPLSCAAGLAALRLARRRDLAARARDAGERLERDLAAALAEAPSGAPSGWRLLAIRRRGLILGLEFDRPVRPLVEACLREGVIVGDCLWAPRVVKIMPPLVIGEDDLREGLRRFAKAVAATAERG